MGQKHPAREVGQSQGGVVHVIVSAFDLTNGGINLVYIFQQG